jgi:hypothetical protein
MSKIVNYRREFERQKRTATSKDAKLYRAKIAVQRLRSAAVLCLCPMRCLCRLGNCVHQFSMQDRVAELGVGDAINSSSEQNFCSQAIGPTSRPTSLRANGQEFVKVTVRRKSASMQEVLGTRPSKPRHLLHSYAAHGGIASWQRVFTPSAVAQRTASRNNGARCQL